MARDWEEEFPRVMMMMGLFFLVVCAVGILRPIKNSLALDGLGQTDFYQVYLVSAAVVLFVPPYNWLSDRLPWRWLIPGVALFFASHLVLFRTFYQSGSTFYGMLFYGWYDLFAAALVTQFFMATQLFFNARDAKRAYPLVIAGGAVGATLGGAITGFFAKSLGTPNLLLVAAGLMAVFAAGLPFVWAGEAEVRRQQRAKPKADLKASEFVRIFSNRHVRLIALSVLLTILVKQLVDYEFNTLTKEVFVTRDAMSAFQGKFNAATQWLPLLALGGLRPLLKRWGIGVTIFLLPLAMLLGNVALVLSFGLAAAVFAKGSDAALRYSVERAGREILYVPVPDSIKLKAKTYIDVAIEKGLGKVASAVLIFGLLRVMNYHELPYVAVALTMLWIAVMARMRGEYVRSLARSFEGRFASLRGVFVSLAEAGAIPAVRKALSGAQPLQAAFALELLEEGAPSDAGDVAPELYALLDHSTPEVRARALDLLARAPVPPDPARVRPLAADDSVQVREAAVRALCATGDDGAAADEAAAQRFRSLLADADARTRVAALSCLARGDIRLEARSLVSDDYLTRLRTAAAADPAARPELVLALAAASAGGEDGPDGDTIEAAIDDPHVAVASAAAQGAGLLGWPRFWPALARALVRPGTRPAARAALARQGERVIPPLAAMLREETADIRVRRQIPSVLSRVPLQSSVDALLAVLADEETDQTVDARTLKALNKLRSRHDTLRFDREVVLAVCRREADAARLYGRALAALSIDRRSATDVRLLLLAALREALEDRREAVFRCLGLICPPEPVHRCYLAVNGGTRSARASALEWLEQNIGHALFGSLESALESPPPDPSAPSETESVLANLPRDKDRWIARLATRDGQIVHLRANGKMDLIEKVFLLQNVDLLEGARSADLAMIASIAEDTEVQAGEVLQRRGEPTGALYVVVSGGVELTDEFGQQLRVGEGEAFGTWALVDESPSLLEAKAIGSTRLLQVERVDFYDLLGENPELGVGMLQGLARRMRALVA